MLEEMEMVAQGKESDCLPRSGRCSEHVEVQAGRVQEAHAHSAAGTLQECTSASDCTATVSGSRVAGCNQHHNLEQVSSDMVAPSCQNAETLSVVSVRQESTVVKIMSKAVCTP